MFSIIQKRVYKLLIKYKNNKGKYEPQDGKNIKENFNININIKVNIIFWLRRNIVFNFFT